MLSQRTSQSIRKHNIIAFLLVVFLFNACAEIEIKTKTTQPPPSPKVRVYIMAFTDRPYTDKMTVSPEEFVERTHKITGRFLSDTGIYEIVPQKEVETTLNGKTTHLWDWTKDNYNFTKKVGKALYADFAMIAVRTRKSVYYQFINVETGKAYEARHDAVLGMKLGPFEGVTMSEELYYQIFSHAKEDLMSIAIRKGKLITQTGSTGATGQSGPIGTENKIVPEKTPVSLPPLSALQPSKDSFTEGKKLIKEKTTDQDKTKIDEKPPISLTPKSVSPLEHSPAVDQKSKKEKHSIQDKTKIIVYDFSSVDWLAVPALILSEALREELFKIGHFKLINREDIGKVLEELKLQQSGLVSEKYAVQIGQSLAAENAITGRLSPLGNTIVLQTKRINMKTMETASLSSVKCSVGNEEKLLADIPELAKRLIADIKK